MGDASEVALYRKLHVEAVPTFFFVNSDGSIAKSVVGGMTRDAIVEAVSTLK